MLHEAFDKALNGRLEWLGDAVVGAAIVLSTSRLLSKPNHSMHQGILKALGARSHLAHLALLYDLQLHDLHPELQSGSPGIEKMCKLFETFVAAVAVDLGIPYALRWLQDLVDPWVVEYIAVHHASIPGRDMRRYQALVRENPELARVSADIGMNASAIAAFGPGSASRRRLACWRVALNSQSSIDASKVHFDDAYPPRPPEFTCDDGQLLSNATTTICGGFWDFGDAAPGNDGHQWVGRNLIKLAITHICFKKLHSNPASELDGVRIECMDSALMNCFALMFQLDVHVRRWHPKGNASSALTASQCAAGFCALIAATYLRHGWDALMQWLDPLLSPWILAAGAGDFRASRAAESRRRELQEHRRLADERKLLRARTRAHTQAVKCAGRRK
ncbi:hypothetical protein DFH08DRAFT_850995 [Mycena albidolilacea]|uniref:RNase III domain-containing protein n=1 Tax=Mycena albidolilacea TaxID=1033008 RepID=A0AAD7AFC3_9AGAR|nr:hypothetical protein DFH08DRAFT_850995 [Mycena albidolilacea]